MTENPTRNIELRLAVVCYGGVALAIYMHGVTKELHKVVAASAALEKYGYRPERNPFAAEDTAAGYYDVLAGYAARGTRLRVVIDIISGTSAGGINGVVLGKAIACNADQSKLKELWMSAADLRKLLRPRHVPGLRFRILLATLIQPFLFRSTSAPLSGSFMSKQLVTALEAMDTGSTGTLIGSSGSLDLYVTTTDLFGTQTEVASGIGGISQRTTDFARVITFSAHGGAAGFAKTHTAALAFAARATSSFPGAFAPVSLASFQKEAGLTAPIDPATVAFANDFRESRTDVADVWFVDGGLLDNAPFDHAVNAIAGKRAQTQVVRRLLYIEPDPRTPLDAPVEPGVAQPHPAPPWMDGVVKAVLGAKGSHSFLPELVKLRDMNQQIAQIGAITQVEEGNVLAALGNAGVLIADGKLTFSNSGGRTVYDGSSRPTLNVDSAGNAVPQTDQIPPAWRTANREMQDRVRRDVGAGYATYVRLKATTAIDYFVDCLLEPLGYVAGSNHASTLQSAAREWLMQSFDWPSGDPTELARQLINFDMPYRERRLQFVIASINQQYADESQAVAAEELDKLKAAAWDAQLEIGADSRVAVWDMAERGLLEFISRANLDSFAEAKKFAIDHNRDFARMFAAFRRFFGAHPGQYSVELGNQFLELTATWPNEVRLKLLGRYLGFPLWDGMTYPIVALSHLPQYSPIAVDQFSPLTAHALRAPQGQAGKLRGAGTFHFGGFFNRAWRENDYLWGRLDSVERILVLLEEGVAADVASDEHRLADADNLGLPSDREALRRGLAAVVASESTDLTKVGGLISHVNAEIRNLK